MKPARTLLASLLLSPLAAAQDPSACRALADDAQRLACYDQWAADAAAPPAAVIEAPRAPVDEAARFGAEQMPREQRQKVAEPEAETLHSRVKGRFDGWKKGQRFTLENGQVWQVSDDRSRYEAPVDSPEVVLERGLLGSYWMAFPAQQTRVKVRRLQ